MGSTGAGAGPPTAPASPASGSSPSAWRTFVVGAVAIVTFVLVVAAAAGQGSDARRRLFDASAVASSTHARAPLVWHDYDRIHEHSQHNSRQQTVVPLALRHLHEMRAPAPFEFVHAVSAWLDTRPLLAHQQPEIAVLATMYGQPYMAVPESTFSSNPVRCYIVARPRSATASFVSRATRHSNKLDKVRVTQSVLTGLRDSHSYDKDLVTVIYTCPLTATDDSDDQEPIDWANSDIYVTLSLENLPPPADVFLPATALPVLDADKHVTGRGRGAVCLPPLSTDLYAPVIRDFLSYYRGLGFDRFYAYILDPGPETIRVLRDVAREDPSFTPIRWALPKTWMKSGSFLQAPSREFRVDPSQWNIKGIEQLPPQVEFDIGVTTDNERDVRIWYFGQHPSQQDCAYRAMRDGIRYVANVDYDEYVSLRPASSPSWPEPSKESPLSSFVDWARSLEKTWDGVKRQGDKGMPGALTQNDAARLGLDVAALAQGMLPSAFVFQSSFMCVKCRPTSAPPSWATSAVSTRFPALDWRNPGLGVPFAFSSPVRMDWLPIPVRSKAVIDPWAWHSGIIHYPGVAYADWVVNHGYCASMPVEKARDCAERLIKVFGIGAVPVRPSPATPPDQPWEELPSGRGALYHVRLSKDISTDAIEHENEAGSRDLVLSEASTAKLSSHRVEQSDWLAAYRILLYSSSAQVDLYEDWSLVALMERTLVRDLALKTRRRPGSSSLLIGAGAIVAFAAAVIWRCNVRRQSSRVAPPFKA
ncbi:hypothetical protein OIV83_006286 [Microbotryomycetes sp. JL201]|nr:hypothetical protein OIV83_006286 [Microbotryomycetes sp. JL201]